MSKRKEEWVDAITVSKKGWNRVAFTKDDVDRVMAEIKRDGFPEGAQISGRVNGEHRTFDDILVLAQSEYRKTGDRLN